jgi:uncharacterized peroxidase-related enzyme
MNASRIPPVDPINATGSVAALFTAVKSKLGVVPNLMRTFAQSPAVFEGYLGFTGALAKGVLPARVREQLALAVGEANGCDYCLSAHTLLGKNAGLAPEAIESARRGEAADPKVNALLQFSRRVLETRGKVDDADLAAARAAGANDAELIEVVAHVAANILTNYTNNVARTAIDFPRAQPLPAAA